MAGPILSVNVVGDRALIARLTAMPSNLQKALYRKTTILALRLEARVKNKLNGVVLKVRTGALRRSIHHTVTQGVTEVQGRVYSSGDVKYAAIHEFGGRTKPHLIVPRKASVLAFPVGGKTIFSMFVNHPGSNIPQRSYMRSTLREMRGDIVTGYREAIREGLRK